MELDIISYFYKDILFSILVNFGQLKHLNFWYMTSLWLILTCRHVVKKSHIWDNISQCLLFSLGSMLIAPIHIVALWFQLLDSGQEPLHDHLTCRCNYSRPTHYLNVMSAIIQMKIETDTLFNPGQPGSQQPNKGNVGLCAHSIFTDPLTSKCNV